MRCAVGELGLKFSSKAAERDFIARLEAENLELKDGRLEGLEAFDSAGEQGARLAAILSGGGDTDAGRGLTAGRASTPYPAAGSTPGQSSAPGRPACTACR